MNKLKVIEMNGQETIDSRLVAEALEVQHKNLLKKIAQYEDILAGSNCSPLDFFIPSEYVDAQRKTRKCYFLTKKGCEMVANKTTGEKGVIFTAMYVEAFNEMQDRQTQYRLPTSNRELIQLLLNASEDTNARVDNIENQLKNMKDEMSLSQNEYSEINSLVRKRINKVVSEEPMFCGRKITRKQRGRLYSEIKRDVLIITGAQSYNQIRKKDYWRVKEFIMSWEPSRATIIGILGYEQSRLAL